jgi:hypothetical protein
MVWLLFILLVIVVSLLVMKNSSAVNQRDTLKRDSPADSEPSVANASKKASKKVRFSPEKNERVYQKSTGAVLKDHTLKA